MAPRSAGKSGRTTEPRLQQVLIEDARILFRNFEGKAGRFTPAGKRTFHVVLDPGVAESMEKDGWNVKYLQPREEGDLPLAHLEVRVKFDGRFPPRLVLIGSKGKTFLDEETARVIDWADIESVDMIIRPYEWDINEKQGVTAYLKALYVKIREDELELKYIDVPESGQANTLVEEPSDEGPPWKE